MISKVAAAIAELCNETRLAYRVGGDEFVMILENADEAEVCSVLEEWKAGLAKISRQTGTDFSTSVGYAVGAGEDVENVVHQADERMYLEKKRGKQSRR